MDWGDLCSKTRQNCNHTKLNIQYTFTLVSTVEVYNKKISQAELRSLSAESVSLCNRYPFFASDDEQYFPRVLNTNHQDQVVKQVDKYDSDSIMYELQP